MKQHNPFEDFTKRLGLLLHKQHRIAENTLSNIFTMRLLGNKTHGDLGEVGMAEFINQFMYDYSSEHVGKHLFRAKEKEEDILVRSDIDSIEFSVSLKAYGDGPLQLSTDSDHSLFPLLQKEGNRITAAKAIKAIFASKPFAHLADMHILPLIYNEKQQLCNIMIFNYELAKQETREIRYVGPGESIFTDGNTGKRKHPIYVFLNSKREYICEVRYGGKTANALQRGLWTHTINASNYFDSITRGWIPYNHNLDLVRLIGLALNATPSGHRNANILLQNDIERFKQDK